MLIDTHAHIDGEEFDDDRLEVISRAKEAGVGSVFIPNVNVAGVGKMLQVCSENPGYLYPMIGLHPEDVDADYQKALDTLERMMTPDNPFIAVGEVGLDFYWDTTFRAQQVVAFQSQVEWALEYDLPLMIHARSAHQQLVETLDKYRGRGLTGVFHCFTGTEEEAQQLLAFEGFALGIGGVLTFKKSKLPEVLARAVPLERVVLETDSPYMAPVPHRGKRNECAFVAEVAKYLSQVYQVEEEVIETTTTDNATRIFKKYPTLRS